MKKIFTLVFAVGMFTLAQAQPGSRDNRQVDQRNQQNDQRDFNKYPTKQNDVVVFNNTNDRDDRYNDKFSMERKKNMEIARVNQEYDMKIQKVKRTFYLGWFEKQRQIRSLEQQRQWELKQINAKYSNRYDNHFDHNNDRSNGRY